MAPGPGRRTGALSRAALEAVRVRVERPVTAAGWVIFWSLMIFLVVVVLFGR